MKNCLLKGGPLLKKRVILLNFEPEQASMQNPLCEIEMTKGAPAPIFPDKLGAAVQLAKLTGWNSVEKVSVEAGDTLSAMWTHPAHRASTLKRQL